jgi:hypothetical protein
VLPISRSIVGTNRRYSPKPRQWDPPWPPTQISDCEWVIVRNYPDIPAALVRRFDATPDHSTYFRVVTWRPTSSGRVLVGRYETLKDADRAVPFLDENGKPTAEPPSSTWATLRTRR